MDVVALMLIVPLVAAFGWNCYMMTCHPENYRKLKEEDYQRKKELGSAIVKAAGPVALKIAERMLKK